MVGPPGGTPFHQMGRTALHRWWRPLVGTLTLGAAALVVTVVAVAVWMVVHYMVTLSTPEPADGRLFENPTEDLAAQLALLGLLTPLVFFTAWVVQRRPMGTVISVVGRMRWRWLLACCGAALVFIAVSYGLNVAVTAVFTKESLGLPWIGWEQFWAPALVILLLVPFQSSAEEFVFRGWLLQAVGSHTLVREDGTRRPLSALFSTPWPAMIVSSAIFVAGHGYTGWAMVDIFAFAMIAAWLAVKTGGLEAPIALHVFNNLMAFLLPAASGDLGDSLKQGGAPWYVLLADIPALLAFSGIVLLLARRYRPATVSPPAPVPPAQPPVPIGHT